MKSHITILLLMICLAFACTKKTGTIQLSGNTNELVFLDDFDGEKPDGAKWLYHTDSKHWSTQKQEIIRIKDGMLQLDLKKEQALDKEYTGSGINTSKRFSYGYYESKMKIPPGACWLYL